jgi:ubiquinone/menaquinone biosynthesis C-methylase UbiE
LEIAMKPLSASIEEMYSGTAKEYEDFLAVLDQSLNPRGPDVLYDKFQALNPTPQSLILDAGCRHAVQACELSRRFGCRVVGIDLVGDNIREAQRHIAEMGMGESVRAFQGDIHDLPFEAANFDLIWCRDVLGHMRDLHLAFRSFARVLKPNGKILIFGMFETDLLTDDEADNLWPPTATVRDNVRRPFFDQALAAAGFSVIEADELRSEWREHGEEGDAKRTSKQLLRIARMRRNREALIAAYGEVTYLSEMANCHWGVYQMLGKLSPVIYTLVNSGAGARAA